MNAKDVMTSPVITVAPETEISDIAKLLLESRVSGVPVVDGEQKLVGIVSEGDLIQHEGSGSESPRRRSWWLSLFADPGRNVERYIKRHGRFAREVMTRNVYTVTEDTALPEIARLLESRHIKRVPVVREGRVVGIISRANLLHGLVAVKPHAASFAAGDPELRDALNAAVEDAGIRATFLNIVVSDGVAQLWGAVETSDEREALNVVLENAEGLKGVENHVNLLPGIVKNSMGAV